ncbi:UNVERIFIED_CONTAM: hypothetical protein ACS92_04010 [Bacillus cereus]
MLLRAFAKHEGFQEHKNTSFWSLRGHELEKGHPQLAKSAIGHQPDHLPRQEPHSLCAVQEPEDQMFWGEANLRQLQAHGQ